MTRASFLWDDRRWHRISGGYYMDSRSGTLYHRAVWEKANGPIPKGNVVHHIDGDPENNALENLECLTRSEHSKRHPPADGRARPTSDERSERLRKRWANRKHRIEICRECGSAFSTRALRAFFCSTSCRQKNNRRKRFN